jgi:group I intron endonuclease
MVGIYKITSPSGRVYIGQSWNLNMRRLQYQSQHAKGQRLLHNSIRKYGWSNHFYDVVHELPEDVEQGTLDSYEVLYWQLYKDCGAKMLNLREPGSGGKHAEETKLIWSKQRSGRVLSESWRANISKSLVGNKRTLGHRPSEQARANMSKGKLGNKNTLGFHPTEETRDKMANSQRGRTHSEETKKKMSDSRKKYWESLGEQGRIEKTRHLNTKEVNSKKWPKSGKSNPAAIIPGLN